MEERKEDWIDFCFPFDQLAEAFKRNMLQEYVRFVVASRFANTPVYELVVTNVMKGVLSFVIDGFLKNAANDSPESNSWSLGIDASMFDKVNHVLSQNSDLPCPFPKCTTCYPVQKEGEG